MPEEMKDQDKGGEDRVSKMKKENQEKLKKKSDVEEPEDYPEARGDTNKDVPPGT